MKTTTATRSINSPWTQLLIVASLFALVWFALERGKPTPPAGVDVSLSTFSAQRAMPLLMKIAQKPHPIGTPENAEVRAYLLAQLRALGYDPQVQTTLAIARSRRAFSTGVVNNILVRKKGSAAGDAADHQTRKALLLTAHYDSVPHGPGAADDGASVAAILETLRALNSGPALQNDLICLFSDGEETGLLGAEAFVAEHPWAKDVGLTFNFEYRGNRGPMLMFETSPGNGRLIAGMVQAVAHPIANSLNYEIYKLLPNDTDLSVFKRAGIPGLNFSAIEGHASYHTSLDRPELLDQATLQHEGDIMLSLVRHFGNLKLQDLRSGDSVYFDFPGLGLVHYAVSAVWPLTFAAAALFLLLAVAGVRRKQLRAGRIAAGSLAFLLIAAALAGAAKALWSGLLLVHPGYRLIVQGLPYNSHWYLLAFIALAVGVFVWMQARLQRSIAPLELAMGSAMVWVILLVAASILVPGASFLLLWPLLSMLLATGALLVWPRREGGFRTWLLLSGAAPGVLLFAPLIRAIFIGLGPHLVFVMIIVLVMLLGLMAGLLAMMTRRLPLFAILAGIALLSAGALSSGFDADHPRPANLFYIKEAKSGQSLWVSEDEKLDAWSQQFFAGQAQRRALPSVFGDGVGVFWASPAPESGVSTPSIHVLSDRREKAARKLELEVKSLRLAPSFLVVVEGAKVLQSGLNGRALGEAPRHPWSLLASGMPADGVRLALEIEPGKAFKIRVRERSFGLPKNDFAPRSADIIVQAFGSSDSTQSVSLLEFEK